MIRHVLAALLVLPLIVGTTSAFAAKNDGRYQKSSEAMKANMTDCAGLKRDLDKAEKEADKRAGTKAAKAWADRADDVWGYAHEGGCSWAQ